MTVDHPLKQSGHRLRVTVDEKTGYLHIEGNAAGLEYLAQICRNIIDQPPGQHQWHLSEAFTTLDEGSPDIMLIYRKEFEP